LAPQGPARASDDLSMRGGRGRGRGGPVRNQSEKKFNLHFKFTFFRPFLNDIHN